METARREDRLSRDYNRRDYYINSYHKHSISKRGYVMKQTQEDVANFLDYVDDMHELEMQRKLESYDRMERFKKYGTMVIMVLSITIIVVLITEVMK